MSGIATQPGMFMASDEGIDPSTLNPYLFFRSSAGVTGDIVSSGLVLHVDAGNANSYSGSGTTWTDLSDSGNNGSLENGPTYSSDDGGYFAFDGTDDFIQFPDDITSLTEATFIAWIKRDGNQSSWHGIIFSRGDGGGTSGLGFRSNTNEIGYHWNNQYWGWSSGLTPPDDEWCMVAVSINSTSATAYLCQESGITSATNSGASHSSSNLNNLVIGRDPYAADRSFIGDLAIGQIYDTALTSTEITQNYNALKSRFGISTTTMAVASWDQVTVSGGNQIDRTLEQSVSNDQPQHDSTDNHITFDSSDHLDLVLSGTVDDITQAGVLFVATEQGIWVSEINNSALETFDAIGPDESQALSADVYGIALLPTTITQAEREGVVAWFLGNTSAEKETVTSLNYYPSGQTSMVKFYADGVDTSSVTSMFQTWYNCNSMTTFSLIDTSSCSNFSQAWRYCSALTSFPSIDTSSGNGSDFVYTWDNCSSLTSFPALDFSGATTLLHTWYNCNSLTSFPSIDSSNVTVFQRAWNRCGSLTAFPSIDVDKGTNFYETWYACSSLEDFPANFFDSWNPGTLVSSIFSRCWENCSSLTVSSVENILVSLAASGVYATDNGSNVGYTSILADAVIDIDYDVSTGSLTSNTTSAITTLKSREWGITINGSAQ